MTLRVANAASFRVGDSVRVGGVETRTVVAVDVDSDGGRRRRLAPGTITLDAPLEDGHAAGAAVDVTARTPPPTTPPPTNSDQAADSATDLTGWITMGVALVVALVVCEARARRLQRQIRAVAAHDQRRKSSLRRLSQLQGARRQSQLAQLRRAGSRRASALVAMGVGPRTSKGGGSHWDGLRGSVRAAGALGRGSRRPTASIAPESSDLFDDDGHIRKKRGKRSGRHKHRHRHHHSSRRSRGGEGGSRRHKKGRKPPSFHEQQSSKRLQKLMDIARAGRRESAAGRSGAEAEAPQRKSVKQKQRDALSRVSVVRRLRDLKNTLILRAENTHLHEEEDRLEGENVELHGEVDELTRKLAAQRSVVRRASNMRHELEDARADREHMREEYIKEQAMRRKLYNEVEDLKGKIRVFARVRPMSKSETARGCASVVECPPAADGSYGFEVVLNETHAGRGPKTYAFDRCFTGSDQVSVFNDVKHLVQSAVDGFNVCIFAYGQTGSGKTFTMAGAEDAAHEELLGIAPRAVREVFAVLEKDARHFSSHALSVTIMELYKNRLVDLLHPEPSAELGARPKLVIKHDADGIVFVEGATVEAVTSAEELQSAIDHASKSRHVSATQMNSESSRSHLICALLIRTVNASTGKTLAGKLTLVDLAGSERVGKSGVTGEGMEEAKSINKSLSALGDVISALTTGQKHIPYRNHKLTHLMSDSLGGNAKTLMFVNVSPADYNAAETESSLNYAKRVKQVENKAEKSVQSGEVAALKKQLASAKAQLEVVRRLKG